MRKRMVFVVAFLGLLPFTAFGQNEAPEAQTLEPSKNCDKMFKQMDLDMDGKLSRAEFTAVGRFFDRLDTDDDSKLTQDEIKAFKGHRRSRGLQSLIASDLDGDKVVTREEVKEFRGRRFTKLDANQDGFVTGDECLAGKEEPSQAGN